MFRPEAFWSRLGVRLEGDGALKSEGRQFGGCWKDKIGICMISRGGNRVAGSIASFCLLQVLAVVYVLSCMHGAGVWVGQRCVLPGQSVSGFAPAGFRVEVSLVKGGLTGSGR